MKNLPRGLKLYAIVLLLAAVFFAGSAYELVTAMAYLAVFLV